MNSENNNSQKTIKISNWKEIPKNYTGITEWSDGSKEWYLNGKPHRTDGAAVQFANGYKAWCLNGNYHRVDGPAVEWPSGYKEWWVNGKKHRTDGPAIERVNGSKEWYLNGKLHRTDGPAREYADGYKAWLLNGEYHRTDGPAVEQADGYKEWYLNGKYHRTDGPAVEYPNGFKAWWINGKRHKVDGPAIEQANGSKEWWVNGEQLKQEEFMKNNEIENNNSQKVLKVSHWTEIPENYTGIVEYWTGTKEWYLNGKFQGTDGYENKLLETNKQMNKKLFANNNKLVDDKKIQNAPKKVYTSITDTKLKNSSLKEKNMEKGIIQTLKDDSSLVAKRVATRKVVNVARDLLVSMMSVGKTKKEINNIKNTLGLILQSDDGKAILSFIIGAMLPFILVQLPEKYHDIAKDMAQEFRVEGIAHFGTMFADFVTGSAFQTAKTLIINALDEVADTKEEKVRVASDLNNKSKNDQIDCVEEIKSNEKRNDYAG